MRNIGLPEILVIFGVLMMFTFAMVLLIGALRWKQSRSVQRALIDKLGSGSDLVAFLQSPAGAHFVRGTQEGDSPLRSIVKSVQSGIVTLALGLGFVFLGEFRGLEVRGIGVLLIFLGGGLLAAAWVSYLVARRWELLGKDPDRTP